MSNLLQVTTVLGCKNSMLREGLKHILSSTRFSVHPEDLSRQAIGQLSLPSDAPLLFIVSADLYSGGPADVIKGLKEQSPASHVVILADDFDLSSMVAALEAGASGYCLSSAGCEALVKYLDLVMLGEVVFPSAKFFAAAAGRDVGDSPKEISIGKIEISQAAPLTERGESPTRNLSSREAEILLCLMQGAPNKVIARRLEVAEATVKVHIKAILRKIRVANRTQAAMWAVNNMSAGQGDAAWMAAGEGAVVQNPRY